MAKGKSAKAKAAKKAKTAKKGNRIAIILDRSSSMMAIRAEAVAAFNEQVKAIKAGSTDMDTKVSLVTFATDADAPTIFNKDVEKLQPLVESDYMPNGMTAMYDAVGATVNALAALPEASDENVSFLVVIISDGQENNSKTFNSAAIAERIKALQATGRWTFTYLGANQDLGVVSRSLNIPLGNTMGFAANKPGAYAAAKVNASATANYMATRGAGGQSVQNFYSGDQDQGSGQGQAIGQAATVVGQTSTAGDTGGTKTTK